MNRKQLTAMMLLFVLAFLVAGSQAEAARVVFRYNGGHWTHRHHHGWHRYWGGPGVGFYWAPAPVYIVAGYPAASYYTGSSFWYANPSFGLSVNIGGGGRGGGGHPGGHAVAHGGGHAVAHGGGHAVTNGGGHVAAHGGGHPAARVASHGGGGSHGGGHAASHGGGGHEERK